MSVKELVDSAITSSKIVIFSKTWCPYCKRAKALFKSEFPKVNTKIIELDEREDGDQIQSYLAEKTGQTSVPSIFLNGKHVGGCDAVVALNSQGKLADLVAA